MYPQFQSFLYSSPSYPLIPGGMDTMPIKPLHIVAFVTVSVYKLPPLNLQKETTTEHFNTTVEITPVDIMYLAQQKLSSRFASQTYATPSYSTMPNIQGSG